MRQPQIRLLAGAGEPARDWAPTVVVDDDALVHVVAGVDDLPRVAPVVSALARGTAFVQRVIAVDAPGAAAALARLGAGVPVTELAGGGLLDALLIELEGRWAVVCVHGEGEPALAASVAAARHSLPVVRIGRAAGATVTGRALARLADLILVPDAAEADALAGAKVPPERVHVVGSPLVAAVRARLREATELQAWRAHGLEPGRYTLVVLSDRATPAPRLPTGMPALVVLAGDARWEGDRLAVIRDPGFVARLSLGRAAGVIVTDSERMLEEAAALGVACRPVGAAGGRPARGPEPIPLWDGQAGRRIAEIVVANFARVRLA